MGDKVIKSAIENDGAETVNYVLENFKNNPAVMAEVIPLA